MRFMSGNWVFPFLQCHTDQEADEASAHSQAQAPGQAEQEQFEVARIRLVSLKV